MKRRRGSLIPRSNGVGARVYLNGRYEWLGMFNDRDYGGREAAKRAAERAIDAVLEAQEAPHRETVESFAERWVTDYPRPKDSTNHTNKYRARRVAEIRDPLRVGRRLVVFPSLELRAVTRPIARAYAMAYPGLRPACRAMFSDALDDRLVDENPFAGLRLPQSKGRSEIVPLTVAEVELLADTALEEFASRRYPAFGPMMRAAVLVAAYTGIRPGELFALEWEWIEGDKLTVKRRLWRGQEDVPKSGRPRLVALPDSAREALAALPRGQGRIFSTKTGKAFTQTSWTYYFHTLRSAFEVKLPAGRRAQLAEARGGGPLQWYELRHACASYLLDAGLTPDLVAKQLGHADSELVERLYGHPDEALQVQRILAGLGQNVREIRSVESEAANG